MSNFLGGPGHRVRFNSVAGDIRKHKFFHSAGIADSSYVAMASGKKAGPNDPALVTSPDKSYDQ